VAKGVRTDPDVIPGGRDRKRADAAQELRIANRPAAFAQIAEAATVAHTTDSRASAVNST
jgi:hypothetical protein